MFSFISSSIWLWWLTLSKRDLNSKATRAFRFLRVLSHLLLLLVTNERTALGESLNGSWWGLGAFWLFSFVLSFSYSWSIESNSSSVVLISFMSGQLAAGSGGSGGWENFFLLLLISLVAFRWLILMWCGRSMKLFW